MFLLLIFCFSDKRNRGGGAGEISVGGTKEKQPLSWRPASFPFKGSAAMSRWVTEVVFSSTGRKFRCHNCARNHQMTTIMDKERVNVPGVLLTVACWHRRRSVSLFIRPWCMWPIWSRNLKFFKFQGRALHHFPPTLSFIRIVKLASLG